MLKLTQADLTLLSVHACNAGEAFDELLTLADTFATEAAALLEKFAEAQNEACAIMEDAANDAESYYDEKSEKWQEGERGQIYDEFKNRLRELADALGETFEAPEVEIGDRPEWIDNLQDPDFSEPNF